MKWIKFDDMRPPIGMHVFVRNGRQEVGILIWEKGYNDEPCQFITTHNDSYSCPREVYDLDHWAPISFFNKYLSTEMDDRLKRKEDWYLKNKDHPNIPKIKELVEELNNDPKDIFSKNDDRRKGFRFTKLNEIIDLIKECNETL